VDDGFLQGPNVDGEGGVNHLDASVGEYESLLVHLMAEGAASLKNLEEMVWSPAQVMCGLMHFVEAGAVGLPDGKRKRALEIVSQPRYQRKEWDPEANQPQGQQDITLGQIREDMGFLQHVVAVAPDFSPFLTFLVRCLKGVLSNTPGETLVSPVQAGEDPQMVWQEFYDDVATFRLVLQSAGSASCLFVSPYEVLLPPQEAQSSPYVRGSVQVIGTDASQYVGGGQTSHWVKNGDCCCHTMSEGTFWLRSLGWTWDLTNIP
jgi:hypothetical protein